MRNLLLTSWMLGATLLAVPRAAAQPTVPTWTLREELRLDSESHDLPAVSSIVVGPRGRMAVYIGTDRQIRVFEADGREAFRFGRQGSGPGEFQQSFLTLRFTGDSLWAFDMGLRRVTFISPDGKLLRTQPLPTPPGVGWFFPQYIAGSVMVGNAMLTTGSGASATAENWLVRIGPGAGVTKIMAATFSAVTVSARSERGSRAHVVPFTAQPSSANATMIDRFAIVTTVAGADGYSDAHVRSFRNDGSVVFDRKIPFRPVPVTASQRDSALAAIEKASEFGAELASKAKPLIPTVHPLHRLVTQGNDGSVLISVRSAAAASGNLLIDPQGTPRAWLTLPPRAIVSSVDATHVWAVVRDEDDLPSLVRYRIVR